MMRTVALALTALAAFATGSAQADEFSNEAAGVKFEVPDGWKSEPHGDMVTVSNADGSLSILFIVSNAKNWVKTTGEVVDAVDELVQDAKPDGEAKIGEHNGMDMVKLEGNGKLKGQDIRWGIYMLAANKPLTIIALADPASFEKDAPDVQRFLQSIKKI